MIWATPNSKESLYSTMNMIPITSVSPSNEGQQPQPLWRRTFDPKSRFIMNWNRFLFVIGIFNFGTDLILFFIMRVDKNSVAIDFELAFIISLLRTIGDSCQLLGIIVKCRTAINDPSIGAFKSGKLVRDPTIITKRYLKSSFIIDFLATLPLLQVYLWCNLPSLRTSSTPFSIFLFMQHVVVIFTIQLWSRVCVLFSLRKKLIETNDTMMRPSWSSALYYLLFYVMLSQFMGTLYYVLYIYLLLECKATVFKEQTNSARGWDELLRECAMDDQIVQGMLTDLYKNKIGSRSFLQRYMYCFSWGLKCLSSMGQNFGGSASVMESSFSFLATIFGLVLFAGLIAQMQTCIQSMEPGEEQQMVRQREVEEWAKNHQIPAELQKRLRQTVRSDMRALRGLDDDTMLSLLPMDLQYDLRRHLYFDRACNLPFFANLDHEVVHSFAGHLRSFTCYKDTYVVIEGEPVKSILLFFNGELEMSSIGGGSSDCASLGVGDLCGSELLAWALLPSASIQNLPCSSQSVKCLTDVEAFCIFAEDLKLLGVQFNYCSKFQQALRWHS